MVRIELGLRATATVLLLVAAVAFAWRPGVQSLGTPPARLTSVSAMGPPLSPVDPAAGQKIVDANIFSATRTAPSTRYRLFESGPESVTSAAPVHAAEETGGEAVLRLHGTLVGPHGASALMRLDAAIPGAQLYREGDRAGGYVVEKISEDSVILGGNRGRIVLRLIHPREPAP